MQVQRETSGTEERPAPVVRNMGFAFEDADVPRWWLHDNAVATHLSNGISLLFPAGERFFIRSVKHYLDRIEDPELKARVRGFFGQEGRHGHEHQRAFRILERQGYDVSRFLERYERVAFGMVEPRVPPILRLSTTVALEHFTATLARGAIESDFLEGAHPVMRALIRWHAAEEIEHKSVAFDVLREIDPRYWVRVAGLAFGVIQLLAWWRVATKDLMEQEGLDPAALKRAQEEAKALGETHGAMDTSTVFRRAILDYLRPSFHPDDEDDYHVARDYLASVGH